MSYTGDPTAAQAPGGVPQADSAPVVNVVVDGTADNSLSIMQQLRALADWGAWAAAPRAAAALGSLLSNWAKPVLHYRNALGYRRFGIDHQGFPGGQIIQWDENWDSPSPVVSANSTAPYDNRWGYGQVANSGIFTFGPLAATRVGSGNPYPSSRVYMEVPTVGGPSFTINSLQRSLAPVVIESGGATGITMHWDSACHILGVQDGTNAGQCAMGMATPNSVTGASTLTFGTTGGLTPVGVAFVGGQGTGVASGTGQSNTTWKAYLNNGTTRQLLDTGVDCSTAEVRRRFKIEVYGSAVADDATGRVLFWIDGNLVQNVAFDLTNGGNGVQLCPFFRQWGEGQSFGVNIGPVRFRANLWPGDVFI